MFAAGLLAVICFSACTQLQNPASRRVASPKETVQPVQRTQPPPAPVTERASVPAPEPAPPTTPKAAEPTPAPAPKPAPAPIVMKHSAPKINLEAERQALLDRDNAFSETSQAKGAAQAFYEFMATDATLLQTGEPPIKGIETIKVRLTAGPQGTLTWKPSEVEVSAAGDLGYTWGTYEFRSKNSERKPTYGKYVNVWKKQGDGTWKVVLTASNASPDTGTRRSESGTE